MPTLLIVDDEPSILHAFRRAFRDDSLEVLTAETAADGLELRASGGRTWRSWTSTFPI